MGNSKAISDIISVVLIVLISLGLVATAYTWGLPLIQKRQDTAVVERVTSYFDQNNANSLPSRIEFIANNGGEQSFTLDISGYWILHTCPTGEIPTCNPSSSVDVTKENNSISFVFFSKVSNIAPQAGFISLTPGASCPPPSGIVGKDKTSVVCAGAKPLHDGYEINYTIWFRELTETTAPRGYKIDLTKHATSLYTSNGKTIRISRPETHTVSASGKTLIIPEIKVLLE